MSDTINPEAGLPSVPQSFEKSDRNPIVTNWVGNGGFQPAPSGSESRVTQPGAAPSANAGLVNYNQQDSSDGVENEGEREG